MAIAELDKKALLVRLSDTNIKFVDSAEDIRGRHVLDRDGEEIGKVNDLYVDQGEEKVRFLEIASGGFLGLGETTFLLPVDSITTVTSDEVRVDQTRAYIIGAPRYSPELVDADYLTGTYDYYGYKPYWGTAYSYPPYPYYAPIP